MTTEGTETKPETQDATPPAGAPRATGMGPDDASPPSAPPPGNDGSPTKPPSHRRLGKHAPKHDPRTLRLARYLPGSIAPAPDQVDWSKKATLAWGMMGNDKLGDCTGAAAGHARQDWSSNNGTEDAISEADVVKFYSGSTGYDPNDPSTDQGGVELDVLNYFRKVGLAGVKIRAFVALDPKSQEHVKQSVFLFGGCYIGLALPESAQNQGTTWTLAGGGDLGSIKPGSWGGHAVWVLGYDARWIYFISWGEIFKMSWSFWNAYCDEAYALLSDEWCTAAGSPSKFDLAQLEADLGEVGDPASSPDPDTAAAGQQARIGARHTLKVTVRGSRGKAGAPDVMSITGVNAAGVEIGVTLSGSPGGGMEDLSILLRLSDAGRSTEAKFSAKDLREFMNSVGEAVHALIYPLPPSMQREAEPPCNVVGCNIREAHDHDAGGPEKTSPPAAT